MRTIGNMKKYCFNEINEVFYQLAKKRKNREKEIIIGGKITVKQITIVNAKNGGCIFFLNIYK